MLAASAQLLLTSFVLSSPTTNTQQYMMWLLDTTSLALSAFFDDNTPPYAILSHTWGSEEVSFQDIQSPHERISDRAGYKKIKDCCAKALEAGFEFVWIDTCCIDKTNSVELSEAINSMFRWYKNSITCYAYLADVKPHGFSFANSRWFKRGWTLQELIAPEDVLFFDSCWNEIGSRESLRVDIERITGVPQQVLLLNRSLQNHCIAEIMSWAARRKTTRLEDRAYSLLGLFEVSMPLIYGEGEQAFIRLQLEIMKSSTDHSLFAWTVDESTTSLDPWERFTARQGALATSPDNFMNSRDILRSVSTLDTPANEMTYEMTNLGLRITLPCSKVEGKPDELFAHLNCKVDGFNDQLVGIHLEEVKDEEGQYLGKFCRLKLDTIYQEPERWTRKPKPTSLYIIQPKSFLTQPRRRSFQNTQIYSLDYHDLSKAGYILEAYSVGSGTEFSRALYQEKVQIIFRGVNLWDSRPWVIFFKHPDRSTRVWVAISFYSDKIWAVIDGSSDKKDTPEVILKFDPLHLASNWWTKGELVEHTLAKTVFKNEMAILTVKRAIISDQVGFLVKIAVLDNEQVRHLGENHWRLRPKECLQPVNLVFSGFGAIERVS